MTLGFANRLRRRSVPLRLLRHGVHGPTIATLLLASVAVAAPPDDRTDAHYLVVHGETHADLFRRARTFGPAGSIVSADTVLPVRQAVQLRAGDLDTPLGRDSADVEVSAWGLVALTQEAPLQSPDGDVQTAFLRLRRGPVQVGLGRQLVTGGATRYARFDGGTAMFSFGSGFDASVYGGMTALPRWNARPAYYNLGSSSDVVLRDPSALPPSGRSGYFLGGARLGWSDTRGGAQISFHEQHDASQLGHRSLGASARYRPLDELSLFGDAVYELDARRFSDARLWADSAITKDVVGSVEYRHAEPALLLSRTSVLSVFSTSGFDELGAAASYRATAQLGFEANGFVQAYDGGHPGARGELVGKFSLDRDRRTFVRLSYSRLLSPDNGYNSLRASVSQRLTRLLTGTLETYFYLYDNAVLGHPTSSVFAGTLTYRTSKSFTLLWSGSIAQTPFAYVDAQTLIQARYDFDFSVRRRAQ
jgi:hypothetical protein